MRRFSTLGLTSLAIVCSLGLNAQNVGIGTAAPAQKVHIFGTTNTAIIDGLVPSGFATAGVNVVYATGVGELTVVGPTPGVFWSTVGNANTTAGTNFIGTTDGIDFVVKTGGNAATNERMRVLSAGRVSVNRVTPVATEVFSAHATGATNAISALGIVAIAGRAGSTGIGVYGEGSSTTLGAIQGQNTASGGNSVVGWNTAATGTGAGSGVYGRTAQSGGSGGWGVRAINTHTNGTGIFASGNGGGGTWLAAGSGGSFSGTSYGAWGNASTAASGTGVLGTGNNQGVVPLTGGSGGAFNATNVGAYNRATAATSWGTYTRSAGASGYGITAFGNGIIPATYAGGAGGQLFGTGIGVYGVASTAGSGTGVVGAGNNVTATTLGGGSGGAFAGTSFGSYGLGTTAASGTGVVGVGNNITTARVMTVGSGGAFTGTTYGVVAFANDSTNGSGTQAGGYFYINSSSGAGAEAWCYTGARVGGTGYKTIGNGTNSTVVPDLNDEEVIMFCPEAPEVLFEDYGTGQLVGGQVHVEIDPIFTKNISVGPNTPLKVFIQLEGDCNGVYVTNKTAEGFDVIELNNGTSNVNFSYHIVANRADDHAAGSRFADLRFPPMIHSGEVVEVMNQQSVKSINVHINEVQAATRHAVVDAAQPKPLSAGE